MSTQSIRFSIYKKKITLKLFQISTFGIFYKGIKNEFETAVVNEPSVFDLLKFYSKKGNKDYKFFHMVLDRRIHFGMLNMSGLNKVHVNYNFKIMICLNDNKVVSLFLVAMFSVINFQRKGNWGYFLFIFCNDKILPKWAMLLKENKSI